MFQFDEHLPRLIATCAGMLALVDKRCSLERPRDTSLEL
jgi:hypothetical protein